MNWVKITEWVRRLGILFSGLCLILFCFGLFDSSKLGWGVSMIFSLSAFAYARKYVLFNTLLKLKNTLVYSRTSFIYGNKKTHLFISEKLKKLTDGVMEDWYIYKNDVNFPYKNFQIGYLISRVENVPVVDGEVTSEVSKIGEEMLEIVKQIDNYIETQERKFRWW